MSDPVQWLRAQLDEDEQAARYAGKGNWSVGACIDAEEPGHTEWEVLEDRYPVASVRGNMRTGHIALHDPARVLREVEAKRRRLERHRPVPADDIDWVSCSHCHVTYPCPDIADDLSVYADRPGYQESWRP